MLERFTLYLSKARNGLWAMMACLMLSALFFSGCMGAQQKNDAPPTLVLKVPRIDQYSRIGTTMSDGQFAIVSVVFQNMSNKDIQVGAQDLVVMNKADKPEEQYEQGIEKGMFGPFGRAFGMQNSGKLLELTPVVVHPRVETERFLVFTLPNDADFTKFLIKYKPQNSTAPLADAKTELVDHRQSR
jgi:hypothetical protein